MKYVALLRGINVGGKSKVRMEDLREIFTSLGFKSVKTYINSGNIIFETAKMSDAKLASKIEEGIEKALGLNIKTMVRTRDEIREIVGNNPFAGKFKEDKDIHVFFLDEKMPEEKSRLLISNNTDEEMYAIENREIFCHRTNNFSDSLMGKDYVGKKLKISATARNWRTVNKILELLEN